MKIILGLLIAISVYANTILIIDAKENEAKQTFLKDSGTSCYYKNSHIDAKNCYKQTGNIFIKFENKKDSDFLDKYNLKFIKVVNQENSTSLYKVLDSSIEIITLVNKINQENANLTARVEWISPRRLF